MSREALLQQAKSGDAQAIATLMNQSLNPKGVTVSVSIKGDSLNILLEAASVPPQAGAVTLMQRWVQNLACPAIASVVVYGKQTGELVPDWTQTFSADASLAPVVPPPPPPVEAVESPPAVPPSPSPAKVAKPAPAQEQSRSIFDQVWGKVGEAAGVVGGVASGAGGAIVGAASGAGGAIVGAATGAGGAIVGAASGAGGAIVGAASGAGGAIVGAASGAGGLIGSAVSQVGQGANYLIGITIHSPELQKKIQSIPGYQALLNEINNINTQEVRANVENFRKNYPKDSAQELSRHLTVEKALLLGFSGLASGIPALGLLWTLGDMKNNLLCQAKLFYEIACCYGFDIDDPERKNEVGIFLGISVGGAQVATQAATKVATKAATKAAEQVAKMTAQKAATQGLSSFALGVGCVIGASVNIASLYAVANSACNFYEKKLENSTITAESFAVNIEEDNQKHLESLVDDQVAMDCLYAIMFLAGNPDQKLQDILPQLEELQLNPVSLEILHSGQLPSLEEILNTIAPEFAIPVIVKCQKIAKADGKISPEEAKILDALKQKFKNELQELSLGNL